jgi:hypothetical protein
MTMKMKAIVFYIPLFITRQKLNIASLPCNPKHDLAIQHISNGETGKVFRIKTTKS